MLINNIKETSITQSTWDELQLWAFDYERIVPLDENERLQVRAEIISLDERGKKLLERIKNEWKRDINTGEVLEFLYYSEGLFQYCDV